MVLNAGAEVARTDGAEVVHRNTTVARISDYAVAGAVHSAALGHRDTAVHPRSSHAPPPCTRLTAARGESVVFRALPHNLALA